MHSYKIHIKSFVLKKVGLIEISNKKNVYVSEMQPVISTLKLSFLKPNNYFYTTN